MNPFTIRLPATSANLGPGFDAVALALELYLDVSAQASDVYTIQATGRSPELCGDVESSLLLSVYEATLREQGRKATPLQIQMHNEIPIGMGCGSSAAVRLVAIALANHFGSLEWNDDRILQAACALEGHPDNAAACWLGGFAAASGEGTRVRAISVPPPSSWMAILVLPDKPLSTTSARAVLPASYSRQDAIRNVQNAALLTAAFYSERADLLQVAMQDWLHQPYRKEVCPLLAPLLTLAGRRGIAGIALSGAGPAVIAVLADKRDVEIAVAAISAALAEQAHIEILPVAFAEARRST